MKTKNTLRVSGGNFAGAEMRLGGPANGRTGKAGRPVGPYPEGCIGADFPKRNYVNYLVERYNHCREADASFGRTDRLQYSAIFKKIESKFKEPTYFIPEGRFGELVDFLQHRIDNTILGRANGTRGISNYKSFDEYIMQHIETAVNA
jgi:hypothetical protein